MTDPADIVYPWQTRRMPDPVRAAALANAVEWAARCTGDAPIPPTTDRILEVARTFEAYLTGEGDG